jgi:uncharacterized protein (TIGR03067 family)
MRRVVSLLVLLAVGVVAAAPQPLPHRHDPSKEDLARLQGVWAVSLCVDNERVEPVRGEYTVIIKGDRLICKGEKSSEEAEIRIDATRNPKNMDQRGLSGEFKGVTIPGLYRLEGDTWSFCYREGRRVRPREFTSKEGNLIYVFTRKAR